LTTNEGGEMVDRVSRGRRAKSLSSFSGTGMCMLLNVVSDSELLLL